MLTESELRALPKVELHCHLDGSLSLKAIHQLATMTGVSLPEDDHELRKLVSVTDGALDLMDYLRRFDVVLPLLQTAPALELAAYDLIEQAAADNIRYIEVRYAPDLCLEQGLTVEWHFSLRHAPIPISSRPTNVPSSIALFRQGCCWWRFRRQ